MTDMFKEKSNNYDASDMVKQLSSAIGECILDNVKLHKHMNVMDFGAGTGLISSHVAPHVNKITAIDISQSMLDRLKDKQELKGKVDILCQDITSEPTGETYDFLMSAMAMHHVKDTNNMIKKFSDHLKPGGKIALADLDKEDGSFHPEGAMGVYHDGFERVDFQDSLEKHGFKDVSFITAHTIFGEEKSYPIFLAVATKS